MPEIPINPMDLPTEAEPLDDSLTYIGTITKVGEGVDKNGDSYISVQAEISDPDEVSGRKIHDNYIRLPMAVTDSMNAKQRKMAMESGVRLGRLCRSAEFKPGDRSWNTDELVGHEIKFTVKNEEYQGRMIPKINEYVFDV
jgi:hypothetical protein